MTGYPRCPISTTVSDLGTSTTVRLSLIADVEGDTFFPDFDDVSEWRLVDAEHFEADEKNQYPYSFLTYERAGAEGHAIPDER